MLFSSYKHVINMVINIAYSCFKCTYGKMWINRPYYNSIEVQNM